MSFLDCINQNPALSSKQKKELENEYNRLVEQYTQTMGSVDAAQVAANRLMEIKEEILVKKKENTIKDLLAWETLSRDIDKRASELKLERESASKAGRFLWTKSSVVGATKEMLEDIQVRHQSLFSLTSRSIANEIEKYRSKVAGLKQDVEGFKNIVRFLTDGKAEDEVVRIEGTAIKKAFDYLHQLYKRAGGIIGKIPNYFPQVHNAQVISKAGFEKWRDTITPLLDFSRMINPKTGLSFTRQELDDVMDDIYQSIITNGLSDLDETKLKFSGGGGVAERHSSSRFFHFKDADSFFEYNRQFGYGDAGLFDAMIGHLNSMSRDIAIMQNLGTKPQNQIQRLITKAKIDGATPQNIKTIEGLYSVLSGRNSFHGKLPAFYQVVQGVQSWIRATLLGSVPISAIPDSFFSAFTSKINGMDSTRVLKNYVGLLNPLDSSDRRVARRISFMASAANGNSIAGSRFMDDLSSKGKLAWINDFQSRANGLAAMTDAARQSISISTQGFLAEAKHSNLKWNDLPQNFKDAFARWKMNESDYDNILKAKSYVDIDSKADFIRPEDVISAGYRDTAIKYNDWLTDMSQNASNEPRLFTQAMTTGALFGDAKQGTVLRASVSTLMMLKSFSITVMMNHAIPALRKASTGQGLTRLSRIAPLLLGTTLLGGVALQAKQVLYGKTQREYDDKFWRAAMLQGGGVGIFGDFLFSDQSRFGNDFLTTLAGPGVGFANDIVKVFKGNFDKTLDDEENSKFVSDFTQFAKRNIPAVKLWYTKLLVERLILDQVERTIDPKFDRRMRNAESKMKKDYGQSFWWKPGDLSPF